MCDEYPMQQLTHGRLNPITGEHTDPVSMILEDLAHRFAPRLEEDQKLVDHELESFARFPNEKFEAMLYRYHYLVARQREEGLQMFSWRHHALRVLKYCGLSGHSMYNVLLSLNNQIPNTQATYEALLEDLKRRTRLVEYSSVNPYVLIQEQGYRPREREQRGRGNYFTDDAQPGEEIHTSEQHTHTPARTGWAWNPPGAVRRAICTRPTPGIPRYSLVSPDTIRSTA